MTKQEFLEKLRLALNGRVSPAQLMENLSYYEDYINTEIRKGKGEEEVLAGLGDPRLIAGPSWRPEDFRVPGRLRVSMPPGAEKAGGETRESTGRTVPGKKCLPV